MNSTKATTHSSAGHLAELSVSRMVRSVLRAPLALLLILLMLPKVPFLAPLSLVPKAQAAWPVDPGSWERGVVAGYLTALGLPESDVDLVQQYGRADLRDDIRALLLTKLITVIETPEAQRSVADQAYYDKFRNEMWARQKQQYKTAVEDRDLFLSNPCAWRADQDLMDAFDLQIDLSSYCGGKAYDAGSPIFGGKPPMPTKDYFVALGLKTGYTAPLAKYAESGRALEGLTKGQYAMIGGFGAGAAAGFAASTGILSISSVFRTVFPKAINAARDVLTVSTKLGRALGVGFIIVLAAVLILGSILAYQEQQKMIEAMKGLDRDYAYVQGNKPDLNQYLTTAEGNDKIRFVLLSMTLPDSVSTAPLPSHRPGDPVFVVAPQSGTEFTTPVLQYLDKDGTKWSAQTYGGWFTEAGLTAGGQSTSRFNVALRYKDWNGVSRVATQSGGVFTITNLDAPSTGRICEPTGAGVYSGDTTDCISYSARTIQMVNHNNLPVTIRMSDLPTLDESAYVGVTYGVPKSLFLNMSGIPAPRLLLDSPLPAGFSVLSPGGPIGNDKSQAQIYYDGTGAVGVYPLNVRVVNEADSIPYTYTISLFEAVKITSPDTITMTIGKPVNFRISTTGSGKTLEIDDVLPSGLTAHIDSDAQATITGIPNLEPKQTGCAFNPNNPGGKCGVRVYNQYSSDFQQLKFNILPGSAANTSATSATWVAGEAQQFWLSHTGGPYYHWVNLCTANMPPWLTFSNGLGMGILSGTPPANLANPLKLHFEPVVNGAPDPAQNCAASNLSLQIGYYPQFVDPNYVVFRKGDSTKSVIRTIDTSTAYVTMQGGLPEGLIFQFIGSGRYVIAGAVEDTVIPGEYRVFVTASVPALSSTQELRVLVTEKPASTIPFPTSTSSKYVNFFAGVPNKLVINPNGYPKAPFPDVPELATGLRIARSFGSVALPPSLSIRELSPEGKVVGKAEITGTPSLAEVGTYQQLFRYDNGVGGSIPDLFFLRIVKPGDLNADGSVDCSDVAVVRSAMGTRLGNPAYNPLADPTGDGIVDVRDVSYVSTKLIQGTRCQ
ncbi:dockerin type I domain-containing protein [Paludibaculum fermentans]|uniref:Dockerin domain-containing protein n=1 Tax=Paludibaculum fermentans TaxID=1473598 RepID=A0A7S7SIA9_PALFE|nr:dockerin type I domain-containing protein [Paludibaculum fermentans]QOY86827.1 hypothetical protein IRI77_29205 [Paludibaculum fermentans]